MKTKSILALAVAGALACGSAIAGPGHHHSATDVSTPMSVDESAPWRANQAHSSGWATSHDTHMAMGVQEGQFTDGPVGTSSFDSGHGSVGYDSTALSEDAPVLLVTEYWLLGTDNGTVNESTVGTGASSSESGYGSVGFDSSTQGSDTSTYYFEPDTSIYYLEPMSALGADDPYASPSFVSFLDSEPLAVIYTPSADEMASAFGEATPLVSEHYLVSKLDSDFAIVLETGPAPEDVAMLESLKNDFFVLTPAIDEG